MINLSTTDLVRDHTEHISTKFDLMKTDKNI